MSVPERSEQGPSVHVAETGWQRRYAIYSGDLASLIGQPVPHQELLSGGLRNTNYRVELTDGLAVLRIYTAEPAACRREVTLLPMLYDAVPVPRVLQARPDADPPWALFEFVDGVRFDHQPPDQLDASAFDAGHTLARIHAFPLERATHVDLNRYSGGGYGFVEFIEASLARGVFFERIGSARTQRLRRIIRDFEPVLQASQDTTLQHSDYKPWNLLVRDGRIAAVLDWEFAFAGPRLNDIANFLRYCERQPPVYKDAFVRGYLDGGGTLPDDWFRLARLQDLMGLAETVGRPNMDPAVLRDIQPLVERTIDLFPQ